MEIEFHLFGVSYALALLFALGAAVTLTFAGARTGVGAWRVVVAGLIETLLIVVDPLLRSFGVRFFESLVFLDVWVILRAVSHGVALLLLVSGLRTRTTVATAAATE